MVSNIGDAIDATLFSYWRTNGEMYIVDIPDQLTEILEPDIDDVCYLFSQAILRLMEEEDAANHDKQKPSQGSGKSDVTTAPVQDDSVNQTQEESIDQ